MPEQNDIDPILLKIIRSRMGRPTNTVGARALQELNIPRSMSPMVGGGNRMPGFNPSRAYIPSAGGLPPGVKPMEPPTNDPFAKAAPTEAAKEEAKAKFNFREHIKKITKEANLPTTGTARERNPAITQYTDMLEQEGIPFNVRISNAHNTAYIFYGPKGNEKVFTLRVPHPSLPHMGRSDDIKRFIDTAGVESIGNNKGPAVNHALGALQNASGGSFSDPNNVRDAIKWQIGKLSPPGTEPFSQSPEWQPLPPKGPPQLPKQPPNMQKQFMTQMMHNDEKPKMPTIMGGDPNNALHSQQLNQRFNLVNPQDLGNYGSKQYDPMTDPSYQAILKILGRPGVNTGNDR